MRFNQLLGFGCLLVIGLRSQLYEQLFLEDYCPVFLNLANFTLASTYVRIEIRCEVY